MTGTIHEAIEGKCNARKSGGGYCGLSAGHGTSHKGYGACKFHGGAAPNHQAAAEKAMAMERMRTYGVPIDVEPHTALLGEIKRTAGHVAWLNEQVADLDSEQIIHSTSMSARPVVLVELYQAERQHLARVCKMALDAGVAERQVRIAEAQGELLAGVIKAILADLGLSPEQTAQAPAVVGRHLRALPA